MKDFFAVKPLLPLPAFFRPCFVHAKTIFVLYWLNFMVT